MISTGIISCSRCGAEFTVSGELIQSIDKRGFLVTELQPDPASAAVLSAHACQP